MFEKRAKTEKRPLEILMDNIGTCLATLEGHQGIVNDVISIKYSDKSFVVSASQDKTLKIWHVTDKHHAQCINTLIGHTSAVKVLTTLEKWGKCFIISGSNYNLSIDKTVYGEIKLWELNNDGVAHCVTTLDGFRYSVYALKIIEYASKTYLAVGGSDQDIKLWQLDQYGQANHVVDLVGHTGCVFCLAVLRQESNVYLVSGSSDESIKLWQLNDNDNASCVKTLKQDSGSIFTLAILSQASKQTIVSGSFEVITLWQPIDNNVMAHYEVTSLKGHDDYVQVLTLVNSQQQTFLVSGGGDDNQIKIWQVKADGILCITTFDGHHHSVWTLASLESDNNIMLFSGGDSHFIKMWAGFTKPSTVKTKKKNVRQVMRYSGGKTTPRPLFHRRSQSVLSEMVPSHIPSARYKVEDEHLSLRVDCDLSSQMTSSLHSADGLSQSTQVIKQGKKNILTSSQSVNATIKQGDNNQHDAGNHHRPDFDRGRSVSLPLQRGEQGDIKYTLCLNNKSLQTGKGSSEKKSTTPSHLMQDSTPLSLARETQQIRESVKKPHKHHIPRPHSVQPSQMIAKRRNNVISTDEDTKCTHADSQRGIKQQRPVFHKSHSLSVRRYPVEDKLTLSLSGGNSIKEVTKSHSKQQKNNYAIGIQLNHTDLALIKLISVGGSTKIYRGKWLEASVAIKQFSQCQFSDKLASEFIDKMSLFAQLRHPNILTLYGIVLSPIPCMVIELMTQSLQTLLRSQSVISLSLCIKIMSGVAKGLLFLHQKNIVHGDIKSSKILLGQHYNVKLADISLVHLKTRLHQTQGYYADRVRWMAPELFEENPDYTIACDVYSFAIVLWELLSRQRPFHHLHYELIALRVTQGHRPVIPVTIPVSLQTLLQLCWLQKPTDRPSMKDVIKTLITDPITEKSATSSNQSPVLSGNMASVWRDSQAHHRRYQSYRSKTPEGVMPSSTITQYLARSTLPPQSLSTHVLPGDTDSEPCYSIHQSANHTFLKSTLTSSSPNNTYLPPVPDFEEEELDAIVKNTYKARADNQLSVLKGAMVTVIEQCSDWWLCRRREDDKIGLVPSNRLQLIESEVAQLTTTAINPS